MVQDKVTVIVRAIIALKRALAVLLIVNECSNTLVSIGLEPSALSMSLSINEITFIAVAIDTVKR